jgi:hypothetical protein
MSNSQEPASENKAKAADQAKAAAEAKEDTVTEDKFKNDPDDSTNPNEAIERHRRQLRP